MGAEPDSESQINVDPGNPVGVEQDLERGKINAVPGTVRILIQAQC